MTFVSSGITCVHLNLDNIVKEYVFEFEYWKKKN